MKLNCKNRTVFIGDNWEVMLGLNAEIADAIITDPPFNKEQMRKDDKMKVDKKKSKQLGFLADAHGQAIQHYKDKHLLRFCQIIGNQHSDGMEAYLLIMACRLLLCHEILKETGSIFLHCDHSSNAYLRMLMDAIFGKENFRNEIVWSYRRWVAKTTKCFPRMNDSILFYAKSEKTTVNPILIPNINPNQSQYVSAKDENNKTIVKRDADGKPIKRKVSTHIQEGSVWNIPIISPNGKERCRTGTQTWTDQKPLKLYTRLVKAVTKPGDLVIDPFCGCATTLIAAENCGCQWIGIDSHLDRVKLIKPQLEKLTTEDLWKEDFQIIKKKRDFPKRTDDKPSQSKIDEFKDELLKRQTKYEGNSYYYYCEICEHPFRREYLEIDHIHPKSLRGRWRLENLQLLCSRCNRRKGSTKTNKEVRKELEAEGLLYHQRALVYHKLTGDSIRDSEAYLEEEANPKSEPRRSRKKAKKVSRRKKNDSETGTLI